MLAVWVAKCRKNVTPYDVVRVVLAGVLLLAAGLKGHQLASEPVLGTDFFSTRWFLIGVVELELFLGLWLISGIYTKRLWQIALACFTLFTCFPLQKALSGAATCGCFGRVEVNPWYTFTLDAAAVASLLRWRPTLNEQPVAGWLTPAAPQITALIGLWLLLAAPAAWAMGTYQPAVLAEDGIILGDDSLVILDPETWEGRRFPLLPFIEDSPGQLRPGERPLRERLAEGDWIVVLYHHDCPKCQEAMPEYERMAHRSAADPTAPRVALIEIPPYGNTNSLNLSTDTPCAFGRLSDRKEWFVQTPVMLDITDSRAIGVFTE